MANLFNLKCLDLKECFVALLAMIATQSTAFGRAQEEAKSNHLALPEKEQINSEVNSEVNMEAIKEKYWALGNETELGVVQNRAYTKSGKFEFSFNLGVLYSDPFLEVKTLGFSAGYHLSEYFSLHLLALKHITQPSSALTTFQSTLGATVDTNIPRYYLGTEAMGSLFYGKLSVLGKSIIYYDFYFLGGLGLTNTESGNYPTPSLGLGQRFYLNRTLSIRLDYRLFYFYENIVEKVVPTMIGQIRGQRSNWNNTVNLGINISTFGIKD